MQDNIQKHQRREPMKNVGFTTEQINMLREENQKLLLENTQLLKSLETEQWHHNNLYKEWKELKKREEAIQAEIRRHAEVPRWMTSGAVFYSLLFIIFLLVIPIVYNLFVGYRDEDKAISAFSTAIESDTSMQKNTQHGYEDSIIKTAPPGRNRVLNTLPQQKNEKNDAVNGINNTNKFGLYKVKTKAYLYNAPDSSTRRNAFIVHWNNSYATLKALDDKKGFIYVVFTNHMGQVSKGWLRKMDLYPIGEIAP